MTRSELIALLAERFPQLVQKDPEMVVTEILGAIHAALVHGDRVEIRGFGVFDLNHRTPRQARNPKTGESVAVPAKWVPAFKAGKELRERVMATTSSQRLLIDLPVYGAITGTRQRESEMHFKDGIAVVQANVAPHDRIGRRQTGEVAETRGRIFDDFGFGDAFQIIGRADNIVGDDVRQVRDDGQHLVMMLGVHSVNLGAAGFPKLAKLCNCRLVGIRFGRQDAPTPGKQRGKARVRPGILGAGNRMRGDHGVVRQRFGQGAGDCLLGPAGAGPAARPPGAGLDDVHGVQLVPAAGGAGPGVDFLLFHRRHRQSARRGDTGGPAKPAQPAGFPGAKVALYR